MGSETGSDLVFRHVLRDVVHELEQIVLGQVDHEPVHLKERERDDERRAPVPIDEWLCLGDPAQQERCRYARSASA